MARAKGEGSVVKLANGRWRASVRAGGKSASAERDTKREAAGELPRLRAKLGIVLRGDDITVADWVERCINDADLAAETMRVYSRMLSTHIRPRLGATAIAALDTPTLQAVYDRMRDEGVGTASIGRVHSILATSLSEAARRGVITHVPTDHARPPKHKAKPPRPLTPEQAHDLLEVCRTPGTPSGPIIAAILLLGLRANEAVGLRWHHIDPDGWVTVPGTKTAGSAAPLPAVPELLEIIGPQGDADPDWPVFPSTQGSHIPTSRQTVHRHWHNIQAALGITPLRRLHDLRHTTGGLLASEGVPTRVIQSVLRHSDAAMSVHYSRPHDPALREALEKLAAGLAT